MDQAETVQRMAEAAGNFLAGLDAAGRQKAVIDFANTRGSNQVMYAGYYPMGLSLDRIFKEMPDVSFKEEVWPKFLRENAVRIFGLESGDE